MADDPSAAANFDPSAAANFCNKIGQLQTLDSGAGSLF